MYREIIREAIMNDFFEKLRWKLHRFMIGRNGLDEFGRALTLAVSLIYVLSLLTNSMILYYISFFGIVYVLYRIFSKNLYVRREENRKFVTWLETTRIKMAQRKDYKIFRCKGCGRNIRVPRGKGKIEVTCPMCGKKTIHRT